MIECAILLEARNPSQNIHRSYYICARHDLFGRLVVEVLHGRIGTRGKHTMFVMDSKTAAIDFIEVLLERRKSAVQRIGVPYLLRHYAGAWDIEELLFPFRQNPMFTEPMPVPAKKKPFPQIIREGEGLFAH